MTDLAPTARERRWLGVLLILGTIAVAFVVLDQVTGLLTFFSDLLLTFFLAWLLAFILSPIVSFLVRLLPALPRVAAVGIVYGVLLAAIVGLTLLVAASLAGSITSFITELPRLQQQVPDLLASWQEQLTRWGLQIDLVGLANQLLQNLGSLASTLKEPLQGLAVASLGIFGNVLIIIALSLFMVADRDRIQAFFIRLVPPAYAEEARLFERTVSRSFGGFLRGQAVMGLVYGIVALATHVGLGLDFAPASAAASGALMAIPFFGPFVSWAPPVLVAIFLKPDALVPTVAIMIAGWLIVMNVLVPKLMSDAVGIPPLVVLASVIVGSKIAGIPGAVFGIPVAAVFSSFFFYYLNRSRLGPRTVAARAARRVAEREGHPVHVPTPPSLTEVHALADLQGEAGGRAGGGRGSAGSPEPGR